jgi:toxin ParE1/3/4
MPEIILSEFIRPELGEIEETIAADNPQASARFVEAAYATMIQIGETPFIGRARDFPKNRIQDLRSFRVSGFDKYLIFYRPAPEAVRILHVYHGARNLDALFADQ